VEQSLRQFDSERPLILQQHEYLGLYGEAEAFLREEAYYFEQLSRVGSGGSVLLQGFTSVRTLKAALMAAFKVRCSVLVESFLHLSQYEQDLAMSMVKLAESPDSSPEGKKQLTDTGAEKGKPFIASGGRFVPLGEGNVVCIGELLNPGLRPVVRRMMQDQQEEELSAWILEQIGSGSDILSLSSEARGLDAKKCWSWLLPLYSTLVDYPLYLEIREVDHLRWILPQLPGRPLVLCRQRDKSVRQRLFEMCRNHLAMVVLSPAKLPDYRKESLLAALWELVDEALASGLRERDLVLCAETISAQGAPLLLEESLQSIALLKRETSFPLMVSVSAVSRSRPLHGRSNAYFAACAIDRGADILLVNPSQREVMAMVQAANELR